MAAIADVRVLDAHPSWTLVEVVADDGTTGIGLTQSPVAVIRPIIEHGPAALGQRLIGREPLEVEELWQSMWIGWGSQNGRGDEGGLAVNAMAALDLATWDLAGKLQNQPIWRLLGGQVQGRVMAYASSSAFVSSSYEYGGTDWRLKNPDRLADESAGYVREGFRAMKYGWGANFGAEDRVRLAAIRDAVGPDVRWMVDVGCPDYWTAGWSVEAAIEALEVLAELGAFFVEEPLPPKDVAGHARVTEAAAGRVHVATGESLTTVDEFRRFIDAGAVTILQPDACQIGITQLVDVARLAGEAGILVAPHSPWSAIAVAAHLNVLTTVDNGVLVEYPAVASFEPGSRAGEITRLTNFEIVEHPPTIVGGYLVPSERPGLGLGGFVPEALDRLAALREPVAAGAA